MFELGEFSADLHRKVGAEVAKNGIDILICLGDNAKYIAQEAKKQGFNPGNIHYFTEKKDIIDFLNKNVKEKDVILFKASNGMKFFEIANKYIENNQ